MLESQPVTEDTFDITPIDPHDVRLFHEPAGDSRVRALIRDELCHIDVRLSRALPLSDPDHYLGLADEAGKDLGVIYDWRSLDAASLKVAEAALERSHLLPKVLKVYDVNDKFGIVIWDVETDHGPRRYTVRNIRDNSVSLSPTRVLMSDVEGDRFEFPDIYSVGQAALEILLKVH